MMLHTPFADQITSSVLKSQPQQKQQSQQKKQQENHQQSVVLYDQSIQKYRFDGNFYYDCSYTDIKTVIDTLQIDKNSRRKGPRGGVAVPFPVRLHIMLENHNNNIENQNDNDNIEHNIKSIVRWQPHGRSFHINDVKKFVTLVMPSYFQQTKFTSFQRQLNLYGFQRVTSSGIDQGTYYHELFLRGRPDLCSIMIRTNITSNTTRPSSSSSTALQLKQPSSLSSTTSLPIITGSNISSNGMDNNKKRVIVSTNTKISTFFEMQTCQPSSKSVPVQSLLPTTQTLKQYGTNAKGTHNNQKVNNNKLSTGDDTIEKGNNSDSKNRFVNNFHIPIDDLHNTNIMDIVFMNEDQYGMFHYPRNIIGNDYLLANEFFDSPDSSFLSDESSDDTKSIISSNKMEYNIVQDEINDNNDKVMDDERLNEFDFSNYGVIMKHNNIIKGSPARKRKTSEEAFLKTTESLHRRRSASTGNMLQVTMNQSSFELKPLPMRPKLPDKLIPMKKKDNFSSSSSSSSSSSKTTTNNNYV